MESYKEYRHSHGSTQDPLWAQPIEILGLTGEFGSGKTLFELTIDPANSLVFDTEKGTACYLSLGFHRIDVPAEMLKIHPRGYKPIDTFLWWLSQVHSIPPGKYRVIALDTVSEIESGLVDWVQAHPQEFGRTAGQYAKMAGLMWGDVKEYWKLILGDLSTRCDTFVFASHMANMWKGDRPTGKRKPKGKETLMEVASLYLQLERKPDQDGNIPDKPSAIVLKSRLASTRFNPETGDIEIIPSLPPRLPVATPAAIRQYMKAPPVYSCLKDEERAPTLNEDEKAELRLATAEAERDAEAFRLEREVLLVGRQQCTPQVRPGAGFPLNSPAVEHSPIPGPHLTDHQALELKDLRAELRINGEEWKKTLGRYGVTTGRELTPAQATDLTAKLRDKLRELLADGMPTDSESPEKGGAQAESTTARKS